MSGAASQQQSPGTESTDHSGTAAPWWQLGLWWLGSLVVALLHNGLWATPNLAFVSLIAQRPGENPFSETIAGDYLLSDLSMTTAARVLGQADPHEVARLHLVVLVLGWAAVTALARLRFGHASARNLTVLLAASPLVTVSMQWLGQPDPVTGLCGIAMVLVRRRWAVIALGLLAGLTHPEQALFMAGVAGMVRWALPDSEGSPGAAAIDVGSAAGGVAIGWGLGQAWFRLNDIEILTPRTDFLDYGLSGFAEHHTQHLLGLTWTLWGPLWLVIVAVATLWFIGRRGPAQPNRGGRAWLVMAAMAVAAMVPVAITLDETRVYAVITAPLLAGGAVWIAAMWPGAMLRRASVGLLVLTAILPGGFATGVTSWRPQLDTADMAAFLVHGTVPEGSGAQQSELTAWLLSPFDFVIPEPPD
ncbi:MAG: hypothetical protein GY812_11905 [Actinomycetia bacterium]|nr:hypothetical protein [Actinomycetes bacterium]